MSCRQLEQHSHQHTSFGASADRLKHSFPLSQVTQLPAKQKDVLALNLRHNAQKCSSAQESRPYLSERASLRHQGGCLLNLHMPPLVFVPLLTLNDASILAGA